MIFRSTKIMLTKKNGQKCQLKMRYFQANLAVIGQSKNMHRIYGKPWSFNWP